MQSGADRKTSFPFLFSQAVFFLKCPEDIGKLCPAGFTRRRLMLSAVEAGLPARTPALCPPLGGGGIRSETGRSQDARLREAGELVSDRVTGCLAVRPVLFARDQRRTLTPSPHPPLPRGWYPGACQRKASFSRHQKIFKSYADGDPWLTHHRARPPPRHSPAISPAISPGARGSSRAETPLQ